jgi:hypothetical protein
VSTRPTNVKSAYITGPGVLTYNKTVAATVGMTASASVTAEAGVVVAKASTQLGVSLRRPGRGLTDSVMPSMFPRASAVPCSCFNSRERST